MVKQTTQAPRLQPAHLVHGRRAEALAATHLVRHGLTIIDRNVRSRWGEIDLVATDGPWIVFVEVRLRSNSHFGGAAASISAAKQSRLVHTAESWLAGAGRRMSNRPCRFDVVLLDALDTHSLEWIRAAFDAF